MSTYPLYVYSLLLLLLSSAQPSPATATAVKVGRLPKGASLHKNMDCQTVYRRPPETEGMPEDRPLRHDDSVSVRAWYRDLTYGEVHLFILGLYSGFVAIRPRRRAVPRGPGLPEGDDWYNRTGYILGYLLKVAVLAAIGIDAYYPSM